MTRRSYQFQKTIKLSYEGRPNDLHLFFRFCFPVPLFYSGFPLYFPMQTAFPFCFR